jgi:aspartate kinase
VIFRRTCKPVIVMKFGGSSLESAQAVGRVTEIVRANLRLDPIVVVSAMGKTTNWLLAAATEAAKGLGEKAGKEIDHLEEYHRRESLPLVAAPERAELEAVLGSHFQELRQLLSQLSLSGELTPRLLDAVASFGERLSSLIVTLAFRSCGVSATHRDARRWIVTDSNFTQASPNLPQTYVRISQETAGLGREEVAVVGGFIGADRDGATTTLGRGGSDFTASIVGAAVDAQEIQIWTDVDGVLTCDPRLVPEARPVKIISFDEAAELAYFGAKVLHPATIAPAKEKGIPVRVLNSRRPEAPGTHIVAETMPCANVLKSVACKRGLTVMNIRSNRMLMAHGFLRHIFEVFDRHRTPVDMVSTSEVSLSLTVDNDGRLAEICADLAPLADVSVEKDQAILCAVGDNIRHTAGVAARVFDALRQINIRMISQGASRLNIGVVVAGHDLEEAARALHREFFSVLDDAVFG